MLKQIPDYQRGLFIALIVFLTTLSTYLFNTGSFVASCFCITIGFALGFYFFFGNKVLPYIASGILLSNLFSRIIFINELTSTSIIKSIGLTIISILIIFLMKRITSLFNIDEEISVKSAMVFAGGATIVSLLGGALTISMMIFGDTTYDVFEVFIKWSTGYYFGIMIFGTTILYSYYYEEKWDSSFALNIFGGIFILIFIFVTSILFSGTISWFTFED